MRTLPATWGLTLVCLLLLDVPCLAADDSHAIAVTTLPFWARLIGTVLGLLLVIYGLFTVPSDQKRYENLLIVWWVRIEEAHARGLTWHTAFTRVASLVLSRGLAKVFGPRLLSRDAVAASIGVGLVSTVTVLVVLAYIHTFYVRLAYGVLMLTLFTPIAFARVLSQADADMDYDKPPRRRPARAGATSSRDHRPRLLKYRWALIFIAFAFVLPGYFVLDSIYQYGLPISGPSGYLVRGGVAHAMISFAIVVPVSTAIDIMFIIATRRLLHFATASSAAAAVLLIILNLFVAIVLCVVPMWAAREWLHTLDQSREFTFQHGLAMSVAILLDSIGQFNVGDAVISSMIVAVPLLMLLHRLIWPAASRLIQTIADEHVLLKRWPLFFSGLGVLGLVWPGLDFLSRLLGLRPK